MLIALAVVALVLLAAVSTVLLDRSAAASAERRASDALGASLGRSVVVRVVGRPFLTQALRGRYRDVRVSGGGLRVGQIAGATLDARLRNAYLPLRRLLARDVDEIACESVEGHIVLPYGELARVARIPGLELRRRGERLLASAALPVPGLNQIARVNGEAVWHLGNGRIGETVWLRIRGVSVVGIALPGIVLDQLLPALDVPIPLPELPYGLAIDGLRPTADGLEVRGAARAVTFRPSADPTIQDTRPGQ